MSTLEERQAILKRAVMDGLDKFLDDYHPPSFHSIPNGIDMFANYLVRNSYKLTFEANKAGAGVIDD